MNFSYGVIAAVGVLVAISLGLIAAAPGDVIEPRPVLAKEISVNSHILPKTAIVGDVLLVEVEFRDDGRKIVDHVNYDISAMQDGNTILSEPGSHRHFGMHPIHETAVLSESLLEIQVTLQGLGHGDDISEPKGIVTTMTVTPEPMEEAMEPESEPEPMEEAMEPESEPEPMEEAMEPESMSESTISAISIPKGVGSRGCEITTSCYSPYEITVTVGTAITWSNDDITVHTVTSGKKLVHDELFDSGVMMPKTSFDLTFYDAGTFDYFCIVHPWMTGIVNVN